MKADVRPALRRRLRRYWQMEAGCALILPVLLVEVAGDEPVGPLVWVAIVPAVALLAAGAAYWRAKLRAVEKGSSAEPTIRLLARLEKALLALVAIAAAAAAAAWLSWVPASAFERGASAGFAALAVAEYVNYYRIQLQHFDHLPDLRRLLVGKGFRRAHLRRDIDALADPRG